MFDGTIASTNKNRSEEEKSFGIQIDSLSDLICFGVLPASLVYSMSDTNVVVLFICGLYVLCALIRLAHFNVDEQERQKRSSEPRAYYQGLPVTLSAVFIPVAFEINEMFIITQYVGLAIVLFVMGILFLLPFPLKKPHGIKKMIKVLSI